MPRRGRTMDRSIEEDGCLICGRTSDAVPVGVITQYNGDGPRKRERAWLCDECSQERDYAPDLARG